MRHKARAMNAYAAAKADLTTYSKGLANEVAPYWIRVNSVAPGMIETTVASRLITRLASHAETDQDTARQIVFLSTFPWMGVLSSGDRLPKR
jgi:NAD(P)-dependent dehydrogenase (short-subunit alcohol dehydrogenase family)